MTNEELLRKVDMFTSNSSDGLLQGEQATKFFKKAIDASVLQQYARTMTLSPQSGGKYTQPRLGFGERILRRGNEGQALSQGQRAKPDMDSITLETRKLIAEVRLSYEVMKNNIEQKGIINTLKDAMAERIGVDLEELVVNGDTASADTYLATFDGMRKLAGNTVDIGGTVYGKDVMGDILSTMPSKHKKLKKQMAYFCGITSEENYREELSNRATVLGDKMLEGNNPIYYSGSRVISLPSIPEDIAGPPPTTEALFLNPRNAFIGLENQVQFEMDKDISAQMIIVVATIWAGFVYEDEDAVVRAYNIGL